jgi:hypothetical protein
VAVVAVGLAAAQVVVYLAVLVVVLVQEFLQVVQEIRRAFRQVRETMVVAQTEITTLAVAVVLVQWVSQMCLVALAAMVVHLQLQGLL